VRGEPGRCPICGMNLVKKEIKPPETALEHAKKHLDSKYVCPMKNWGQTTFILRVAYWIRVNHKNVE